jgi:hypothetical protein
LAHSGPLAAQIMHGANVRSQVKAALEIHTNLVAESGRLYSESGRSRYAALNGSYDSWQTLFRFFIGILTLMIKAM